MQAWEPGAVEYPSFMAADQLAPTPAKTLRALVVEDEPQANELFADALRDTQWAVKTAMTATEAKKAYQPGLYDLITLDINLPDQDGLSVCRWLRQQPGGDLPFILAITARSGMRDLTEILKAGANDYLAKPFEIQALLVRLAVAHNQILLLHQQAWLSDQVQTAQSGFHAIFEHPSDLNFVVNFEGAVISSNIAAQTALGMADLGNGIVTTADLFVEKEMPPLHEMIGQQKTIRSKLAGRRNFSVWGHLIPWQGQQALLLNMRAV